MNKRCAIPLALARSLACSFAPRLLALDERERWNGAERSGRKRNNTSVCGQMVSHYARSRYITPSGRIASNSCRDYDRFAIFANLSTDKFGDTDVFRKSLCRLGNYLILFEMKITITKGTNEKSFKSKNKKFL